jgi:very-short-patch-repair endonuclease
MPNFKIYNYSLKSKSRDLRKNLTPAEKKLWFDFLRTLPIRFTKQKPIAEFIVDFYCAKKLLVIEIDGDSHYSEEALRYDEFRSKKLQNLGIRVIRFSNLEVMESFEDVCGKIAGFLNLEENL